MLENVSVVLETIPKIVETLNEMKSQAAERDLAIVRIRDGSEKTEKELERLYQESRKASMDHSRKLDELTSLLQSSFSSRVGTSSAMAGHTTGMEVKENVVLHRQTTDI